MVGEFEQLLELGRTSAEDLIAAGIAPQSAQLHGWLVIQRLDRTEIIDAPEQGDAPRRHESYEQIWLTADGRLRVARHTHVGRPAWIAGQAVGGSVMTWLLEGQGRGQPDRTHSGPLQRIPLELSAGIVAIAGVAGMFAAGFPPGRPRQAPGWLIATEDRSSAHRRRAQLSSGQRPCAS